MGDIYDEVREAGPGSFPASDSPAFPPLRATGAKDATVPAARFSADFAASVFREVDVTLLPPTGRVHLALLEAEDFLGTALGEWGRGGGSVWGAEVAGCLAALRIHLNEHRANIEAEGSLSHAVKAEAPWLLSQLQHLLRHHDELGGAIVLANAEYEKTEDDVRAAVRVHRRARGISAALTTLLSVERALLMAQFCEPQAQD